MSQKRHAYQDLIMLFNDCFADYNTRLVKGADEPVYLPASELCSYHQIIFAHGYFSSALHEISHWLIAGPKRRLKEDFGYWYRPDGRNEDEQKAFEQVEVKPQAIEWILSQAAGYRFYISADNLNGEATDNSSFKEAVYHQVVDYAEHGLSKRAQSFREALVAFYGTGDPKAPILLDAFHIGAI